MYQCLQITSASCLLQLHGEMATPSGHSPPLDRPEQAVELIQEAAARCSLQLGKHLGIVLEAQAAAFFNAVSSFVFGACVWL